MLHKGMTVVFGLVAVALSGCADLSNNNSSEHGITPYLQDLVGVKGRDAEYSMEKRGFVWIRTEKSDTDAYSYWRHNRSDQCICVRTTDGRYTALTETPDYDCQGR